MPPALPDRIGNTWLGTRRHYGQWYEAAPGHDPEPDRVRCGGVLRAGGACGVLDRLGPGWVGQHDQLASRGAGPHNVLYLPRVQVGEPPPVQDAYDLPCARRELGERQLRLDGH